MQRRHLFQALIASQLVLVAALALPVWSADHGSPPPAASANAELATAVALFRRASGLVINPSANQAHPSLWVDHSLRGPLVDCQ